MSGHLIRAVVRHSRLTALPCDAREGELVTDNERMATFTAAGMGAKNLVWNIEHDRYDMNVATLPVEASAW